MGVVVYTRVHTPRFCGLPLSAGVFDLSTVYLRPLRTSWLIVGKTLFLSFFHGLALHKTSASVRREGVYYEGFRCVSNATHPGVSIPSGERHNLSIIAGSAGKEAPRTSDRQGLARFLVEADED